MRNCKENVQLRVRNSQTAAARALALALAHGSADSARALDMLLHMMHMMLMLSHVLHTMLCYVTCD